MTTGPEPNGCVVCGLPEHGHAQRWKPPAGWHTWTAPTDAQRLARMKARRAARIAQPEPETPTDLTGIYLRDEDIETKEQP